MEKVRHRYLVAYDVCQPKRLQKICKYLTGYKVAGQKSVFEIWATPAELAHIRGDLESLMDADEDRVHILALDPRMRPHLYGRAATFSEQHFVIA